MKRRAFLATGAASFATVAGCLGGGNGGGDVNGPKHDDDLPQDDDAADGYPPEFETTPEERSIDTGSYDTEDVEGTAVPLAPIEDVYYWYGRGEARFVDARGRTQYDRSHVYGAVLSPASQSHRPDDDVVVEWPEGDRVVCYCGCPHHLSSIRAAELIDGGYENVYVIDEGYREWSDRKYPMAGNDVGRMPKQWVVRGETDPALAGQHAWGYHDASDQMESTDIAADGSYELHLGFYDVGPDSEIRVETPDYTVEGTLSELTAETVQG